MIGNWVWLVIFKIIRKTKNQIRQNRFCVIQKLITIYTCLKYFYTLQIFYQINLNFFQLFIFYRHSKCSTFLSQKAKNKILIFLINCCYSSLLRLVIAIIFIRVKIKIFQNYENYFVVKKSLTFKPIYNSDGLTI